MIAIAPRVRITKAQTAELRAKMVAGRSRSGATMAVGLREALAPVVLRRLDELSAFADTNRYMRAWQEAANAADLVSVEPVPLVPSRFAEQRLDALEEQVKIWTAIVERSERTARVDREIDPNTWPSYRRYVRIRDEAIRRRDEFAKSDFTAAYFYGRVRKGKLGLVTVSRFDARLYGGTGSLLTTMTGAFYQLVNREPHARIVERRKRWAFDLAGEARTYGARRLRAPAAKAMAQASGLKLGRDVARAAA